MRRKETCAQIELAFAEKKKLHTVLDQLRHKIGKRSKLKHAELGPRQNATRQTGTRQTDAR